MKFKKFYRSLLTRFLVLSGIQIGSGLMAPVALAGGECDGQSPYYDYYQQIRTESDLRSLPSVLAQGRIVVQPPEGQSMLYLYLCNDITITEALPYDDFRNVMILSNLKKIRVTSDLQRPLIRRFLGTTLGHTPGIYRTAFEFTRPSSVSCTRAEPCQASRDSYYLDNVYGLLFGTITGSILETVKISGNLNVSILNADGGSGLNFRSAIGGAIGEAHGTRFFNVVNDVNLSVHYARDPVIDHPQDAARYRQMVINYPREENDLLWAGSLVGVFSFGGYSSNTGDYDSLAHYHAYQIASKGNISVQLEQLPRTVLPPFRALAPTVAAVGGMAGALQGTITDSYSSGLVSLTRNFTDAADYPESRSVAGGMVGRNFGLNEPNTFRIRRSYSRSSLTHESIDYQSGESQSGDAWGMIGNRTNTVYADYESRLRRCHSASDVHGDSMVSEYLSLTRTLDELIHPSSSEFVDWNFVTVWNQLSGQTPHLRHESQWPDTVCLADINEDGFVSNPDLFAFLSLFFAQNIRADFDQNGNVGTSDIFAFLTPFFENLNQACPD